MTQQEQMLMIRRGLIILDDPKLAWHTWSADGVTVHSCGHAFRGDAYHTGVQLAEMLGREIASTLADDRQQALKRLLRQLNGSWAFVAETAAGEVVAAADIIRSIPLFFASGGTKLLVAWSCHPLLQHLDRVQIDAITASQFFLSGLSPGSRTLYEGIRQLQMGECLYWAPDTQPLTFRYFTYLPDEEPHATEEELQPLLLNTLDNVFSRYYKAYKDDTIAVPFSGGVDSRILAAMLKRHGFGHVFCFTYGRPDSLEVRLSKEAAEAIGYEWQFYEYDKTMWQSWRETSQFAYWDYASRGASLPHIQDTLAVEAMNRSYDARLIFMPGHTALDAYNTPWNLVHKKADATIADLVDTILATRFSLWPDYRDRFRSVARQEVRSYCAAAEINGFFDIYSHHNRWCVENRESKYIVNSVRAYEFFGQGWALPLWDLDVARISLAMPVRFRWRKRLLVNTLLDKICTGALAKLADVRHTCYYGEPTNARVPEDDYNIISKVRAIPEVGFIRSIARRITPLIRLRNSTLPAREMDPLMWEQCFCGGAKPDAIRLVEVMRAFGTTNLPLDMQKELHTHGSLWLQGAYLERILAPIILAREHGRIATYRLHYDPARVTAVATPR